MPLDCGVDNGHVFSGVKRSLLNATGMLPEFSGSTKYVSQNAKVFLSRLPIVSIVFLFSFEEGCYTILSCMQESVESLLEDLIFLTLGLNLSFCCLSVYFYLVLVSFSQHFLSLTFYLPLSACCCSGGYGQQQWPN